MYMLVSVSTGYCIRLCYHTPPGGAQTVWECNNFPSSDPLSGCNWNPSHFHWGEDNFASVPDPAGGSSNVLQVFYPEGSWTSEPSGNKGGCQFEARAFSGLDEATLTYDVYFSPNFDFVLGGKLPGLYGGESGTGWCSGGGEDTILWPAR